MIKDTKKKQMMLYAKLEQRIGIENYIKQKTDHLAQNECEKISAMKILEDFDESKMQKMQEKLNLLSKEMLQLKMNEERKARKQKLKEEYEESKIINEKNKEVLSANILAVEKLKNEISRISEETKNFQAIEIEYGRQKEEVKKANEAEREISGQIISLNAKCENMKENQKKLFLMLKGMEQKKEEVQKQDMLKSWIEQYFVTLTEEIEKNVMLTVYYEFNELFVNWFSMLINDENLQTRLDENFSPVIIQNGFETGIEGLSGGEKTSLALAYRLALNKVINDIITNIKTRDLIILDEPTDGFSLEQLDNVRNVLEELNVKQTIIVSHESKIESFAENVINIKKENNESRISQDSNSP
jgi:exonuclease SbcC